MPRAPVGCLLQALVLATLCAGVSPAAHAKESTASVRDAEQYIAAGDLKAAVIELKNAVLGSPEDPAIRIRLAQLYLQTEDFGSAEREARAAREFNGNEADYLPILGEALLRQRKFKDLLDQIEPGDRDPVLESKVRTAIGIAAAEMLYGETARAMLRDAIQLDPNAVRPKVELAKLLDTIDPKLADQVIDEGIGAHPKSVELLQTKGEIQWSRGDADGAVRFFDKVLEIDPENLRARLSRAGVSIARGQFAVADQDIDRTLQANPDNFMANYLRGWEQVKKQQYAAADRTFDRISPAFAVYPNGYYLQGLTKMALGQFATAEGLLNEYLGRVRDHPQATRLIARAALQQHAALRAIEYLKPLTEKLPPDAATLTFLGDAYMADGRPAMALEQFEKAAVLDPQSPAAKTRVAVAELGVGRGQEGLAQLEEVFAGGADAPIAGPALVLAELHAGRIEKAATVVASLVERDKDNPLYHTLLGEVRVAQRAYAEAEAAYRAALAHSPEFAAATRGLAQLYITVGRIGDANKVYGDLLSKNAADVTALVGLADIAIGEKKWSEATDLLNSARGAAKFDPAAGLKLVGLYEMRRDWKSAKAVAADLSAQFPRDVNVIVARGRTQLESGEAKAAISSYKLAHQLAPASLPILGQYVALLKEAHFFRDAWDALREAVARDPRNTELKVELVRVDAEVDGVDRAISRAREFAEADRDNSAYDLVAAELYEKAGRANDAKALLAKALAARPAADGLAVALSQLYLRGGDFGKAETVLIELLKRDPKNIAANSALAPLYLMTGRPDAAKEVYHDILAQRPSDISALLGVADIAVAEKQWPQAIEYIGRAEFAAPNDPAPGLMLVNMYGLRRDWREAVAAATKLVEKFPRNVDVIDKLGHIQIAAGDASGAVSTYRQAHNLAPGSRPILSSYLGLLKAEKNFAEAQTTLRAALDRNPRDPDLKADLIRLVAEIGGLEAGFAAARDFAKEDPDSGRYDMVSAELSEKAGHSDEALGLLEKAVAARPSDTELAIALSRLYARKGMPSKAEAVLKARLKDDPQNFAARSELALFYARQGQHASAIGEYSRLIELGSADPSTLNNLAWLYQRQGELATARDLAQRAFALSPRDPNIDDTLGWILLSQGEPDKAMAYLSAANLSAPRSPDIQYHLAVALHRIGRAADARAMLESLLRSGGAFADRAEAEKLLQELKRG